MTIYMSKRKKLYRRVAIAYAGVAGMILVGLGFSLAQGAGWKPVLSGGPVYLTFFTAVSYQFIKELRALKQEEREEGSKSNEQ
ncbi:hypothetical protein AB4851_03050 [Burkholderia sp. 22PA0099]|uniref:hypothetical protein n=1 Tax=Burkholderia sp. 22PA0099 TaxID=3237372 RepID=UPI0039C1A825